MSAGNITVLSATVPLTDLVAALRDRRRLLGLPQLTVDAIAGLPDGYQGKLEASLTNPAAKNARGIGRESLPLVLGALKLRLAVVPDGMLASSEHSTTEKSAAISSFFVERAKAGARARNAALSAEERSARARAAAAVRWASKGGRA